MAHKIFTLQVTHKLLFFKVVYRRHTNFAVEAIEQTFNGAAELDKKFSCTISRNGDLLHRVYLELDLKSDNNGTGATDPATINGFDLIDYAEVEIGGQCIDKHYGEWMELWTGLTHGVDKSTMLTAMLPDNSNSVAKNYIPLQFWFCRNPGLALPLIALQYHEVKLNVKFNSAPSSSTGKANNINNCCVFCDYIFLDTDERRRFAQVSHEYLIEQVQFSNSLKGPNLPIPAGNVTAVAAGDVKGTAQAELRFNHPVKELVWIVDQVTDDIAGGTARSAVPARAVTLDDALLQLNGHDRFRKRKGTYFTDVQRYQHHSGGQKKT